jgi:phosphoribosylformylglycinamidine (FGAM) synthase-like enzyme
MVGELPDVRRAATSAFTAGEDQMVALIGPFAPSLLGSELTRLEGRLEGSLEPFDLRKVREALAVVRDAVRTGAVTSAHDISDGGLAACVTECALHGGIGATLDLEPLMRRAEVDGRTALFGEGPGGVVVAGPRAALLELSANAAGVGFLALGAVGGRGIAIAAGTARIDISLEDAGSLFESALAERLS